MTEFKHSKIAEINVVLNNEKFILTNQRIMYWEDEEMLLLSDLHIGKTAHFRKHGIPIPDQVMFTDLVRLERTIKKYKPKHILIVGDLFHADSNSNFNHFKDWIHNYSHIKWLLVKGNHDKFNNDFYENFGFEVYTELLIKSFKFIHEPQKKTHGYFNISGHKHPGVRISLKGRQYIKLPCFKLSECQLILPAFSLFTGLSIEKHSEEIIYYPFTDNTIWKYP